MDIPGLANVRPKLAIGLSLTMLAVGALTGFADIVHRQFMQAGILSRPQSYALVCLVGAVVAALCLWIYEQQQSTQLVEIKKRGVVLGAEIEKFLIDRDRSRPSAPPPPSTDGPPGMSRRMVQTTHDNWPQYTVTEYDKDLGRRVFVLVEELRVNGEDVSKFDALGKKGNSLASIAETASLLKGLRAH